MSDEDLDPNTVPTKPLPVVADPGTPTEPLAADFTAIAASQSVPTMPHPRPTWIAPAIIVGFFALLLVVAAVVLPQLLAQGVDPVPGVTPTLAAPTPTLSEDAPPVIEEPVVVEPEPTEVAPEPTETAVVPEPTPSATP